MPERIRNTLRSARLWALLFAVTAPLIASQSCDTQEVVEPPLIPTVAEFEADSLAGIAPHTVQFRDKSAGNPNSHFWAFGDDSTSTEKNPLHVYERPGIYSVTLICENSQGFVDTLTKADYITVDNCAVVDFIATPASGDYPHTVTFHNRSQPSTAGFLWDFGDGNTSPARDPVYQYNSCGTFDVTLTVSATCGVRSMKIPGAVTVTVPTTFAQSDNIPPRTFWPPRIGGDCEFAGNGPTVSLRANLQISANSRKLEMVIRMIALEQGGDWTHADGEWTVELYEAPPDWSVSEIITTPHSYYVTYGDDGHGYKTHGNNWVTFESKGDTGGNDICNTTMDDTHVIVTFGTISIEIQEDC
jgi:PKD repeat protein